MIKTLSSSNITNHLNDGIILLNNSNNNLIHNQYYDKQFEQIKLLMKYTIISIILISIFGGTFVTSFYLTVCSFYNNVISFIFGVFYLLLFYEILNKFVCLTTKNFNYFIHCIRVYFFLSLGELIYTFSAKKFKKKLFNFSLNDENSFENFFFVYETTYILIKCIILLCFSIKLNKYKKNKLI